MVSKLLPFCESQNRFRSKTCKGAVMAETNETEHPPQTNGLPEENEEDDKSKMRPADIDADMREMERRKRVEMIMSSRLFREELERIIESQMKEGGGPAGLLQQIQDMVGGAGRLHSGAMFKNSNCVVPINDIRGVESMGYAKGEKILRCKLASVFRLMDLYGWTHGINNNITARLNQEEEHFIVNPYGMMFHEVTASSLVKVDMQGNIVESGTTNFGVNTAGFQLHAAVHSARPDIKCIIHIHTPSVLAVSSLKCGLLPICQESAVIGEISQHPYLGPISEPEEKDKIARNLGPINKVMFLTNYGAVCCGETVEEAFYNVYNTVLACETQVKLMPLGVDNLLLLTEESRKQMYDAARRAPEGTVVQQLASGQLPTALEKKEKRWRIGGMEFEALMRMLDNAGFRTGYIYRTPLVKGEPPRPRNDVEVPPAVSSLGYLLEEEEMYKQGNWKKGFYNKNDRTRWLNSPNVYQKVEILETGTPDPKKITKWVDANADEWVADGSPTHTSTPVKIDGALQFVPKNTNPKEFKKLQQQIKENRRADKITSGPQSHILDEGVSWDEAKKLQDANISMTGDQVIMVGTASKGIIQRGFQHNATVYKTPYAKNPFDYVSDQELEDYKKVVIRKQKGDYYDEDQSESEPLSSSAALPPSGVIKSPPSETEDDSRTEPRVLRIETKTVPVPSQAEVVLSDDDYPSLHVERSKSQRYPPNKVAEKDAMKRSASLERPKTKPVITDGRGNSSPVGVVKARILTLEQLSKEKSTKPTVQKNPPAKVKTRTTSTQTMLRMYIEEDTTDYRSDRVGSTMMLPSIIPSVNTEPNVKKTATNTSSHQIETERRKSLMFEVHRELSVKFQNKTILKENENLDFGKEEYASCVVYSLPNKTTSVQKEQICTTDFTSDDSTCSSSFSTLGVEDANNKDESNSIRSYVGEDYQVGENMGSLDHFSCNNSGDSLVSSDNAEDNIVECEDIKNSQIVQDCSEIKLAKELCNNVTVRKQNKLKNIISEENTEEIRCLLEDLLMKVCMMEKETSAVKDDDPLHHSSSISLLPPDSHSSPLTPACLDSGYEADTDRTLIHNGTALFARFNIDYTVTDLDEPSPLPPRRKLDSLDEFNVMESAANCVKATDSVQLPRPSRSYSFEYKEQHGFHHSDMNTPKCDDCNENKSLSQSKSEEDSTKSYCIAPQVIYLQNGLNQVIAFKRTTLDSDSVICECNQNLKKKISKYLTNERNDRISESGDSSSSSTKIVEDNKEQSISSTSISRTSVNSPVKVSINKQTLQLIANRISQKMSALEEARDNDSTVQPGFIDQNCNIYSVNDNQVSTENIYSHMTNGIGEEFTNYCEHSECQRYEDNPSFFNYNCTFPNKDAQVDPTSYSSLKNPADLNNVSFFNGMLYNNFVSDPQESIYALTPQEPLFVAQSKESLYSIESQRSGNGGYTSNDHGPVYHDCEQTHSSYIQNYPAVQESLCDAGQQEYFTGTGQESIYNQEELMPYYPQQYFVVQEGAKFNGVPPVNIHDLQERENQEYQENEEKESSGNYDHNSLDPNYNCTHYSQHMHETYSNILENKMNHNSQNLGDYYQNCTANGQIQVIPQQCYNHYSQMDNYENLPTAFQYNPYEADGYLPEVGFQPNHAIYLNIINSQNHPNAYLNGEHENAFIEYDNGCQRAINDVELDQTYSMNYMYDYACENEAVTSFGVNNNCLYTIYESNELTD
ncbi:adducin 1-like protein hts isoform X4 [Rhodnius prolixus]|uniref:adducin 1-like protein hts isoform X4 n=1 Tax=Rhodnius prolixus TaxID=13249 RepID=UPI003D18E27A